MLGPRVVAQHKRWITSKIDLSATGLKRFFVQSSFRGSPGAPPKNLMMRQSLCEAGGWEKKGWKE
jgi:hypothetical protein